MDEQRRKSKKLFNNLRRIKEQQMLQKSSKDNGMLFKRSKEKWKLEEGRRRTENQMLSRSRKRSKGNCLKLRKRKQPKVRIKREKIREELRRQDLEKKFKTKRIIQPQFQEVNESEEEVDVLFEKRTDENFGHQNREEDEQVKGIDKPQELEEKKLKETYIHKVQKQQKFIIYKYESLFSFPLPFFPLVKSFSFLFYLFLFLFHSPYLFSSSLDLINQVNFSLINLKKKNWNVIFLLLSQNFNQKISLNHLEHCLQKSHH